MINPEKSPESAKLDRKLAKFYREHKGLEQMIAELARFEETMRESAAKIGVYESMTRRLQKICPADVAHNLLSQIEARTMLVEMRKEVQIAVDVVSRFS